jgi:predicted NAD/FAD-binding protein
MKKRSSRSSRPLTRRNAIKGASAAGLASIGVAGCGGTDSSRLLLSDDGVAIQPGGRKRVAVIGGGAGGIATAYFLNGTCDVDLFESRTKIGGHCDSQVVDYQGTPLTVDLGAQFFHPATHPIYVTLLEELGLYDPDHPDTDQTLEAPGSICIFPSAGGAPRFTSTNPLATPFLALDFALYSQLARQAVLLKIPYEITLDTWIKSLPVSFSFKNDILYPWISSLIGSTRASALRSSARSILQTFALAFPANIFDGASTFNSKIGLQGNLQRLLDRSTEVRVHLDSPVNTLSFASGVWTLQTPAGPAGPFDAVVMNAPPMFSRTLLRPLAWASDVVALLDAYEYFDSRILVHTDAAYVHRDRANWAVYNAGVDGLECEGSAWLGALHEKLPSGGTVDVFKSWAQRRRADPTNILLERRFKHPLITKEAIRAARSLRPLQGRNGLSSEVNTRRVSTRRRRRCFRP